MSDLIELTIEIEALLHSVACSENIDNYDGIFDTNSLRGDGFLGEFFIATILDRDNNSIIEVAIKKAFKNKQKRTELNIEIAFLNEVLFYSKIFPILNKLQTKSMEEPFVEIAKFYYGTTEEWYEALVLENLKTRGYIMRNKSDLLDEEHASLIFKTYGKFHALSFALKDQNGEEYHELVKEIKDFIQISFSSKQYKFFLNGICQEAFGALETEEYSDVFEYCAKYRENIMDEFLKKGIYKGDYGVINHGDCWSNNMMFKYSNNGNLESMKLIDFQLIREGSPVFDLSYFFYTGGTKELFNKLNDFLKIYHDSLSKNLRELGSDPEKLYPFEQLQEDWKNYGLFGVVLSLFIVKVKLLDINDVQNIVKDHEEETSVMEGLLAASVNKEVFNQRAKDIILHAYESKVL